MAIDRADFADECVQSAIYCGVPVHYVLAIAQWRSGITEARDGDLLGPFKLTRAQWNANRTDADLDIEVSEQKMDRWEFHPVVFAMMTMRMMAAFPAQPTALELAGAEFPGTDGAALAAALTAAFAATAADAKAAWKRVLDTDLPAVSVVTDPAGPPAGGGAKLRLTSIPVSRRPVAQLIADRFAQAGFGVLQQATAVANAKAESALNPSAHAGVGEDSWGLFQLNRQRGLGQGHSPDELKNPERNIAIIVQEARKFREFAGATTIEAAVSAFVRKVERPRDIRGQTIARVAIAQALLA